MLEELEVVEASGFGYSTELQGRRYKVRLIEGNRLGSSGYYPADMLLRDGPKIFTKGTPMYLDHQTPEERENKPFGSVSTFAAELAEDAYYEKDGLYAEIEVFEHHMPMIKSLKDRIGISIRARGLATVELMEGKRVKVFQSLTEARSADFVVRAGAGGKIVSILESAELETSDTDSESTEGKDNMDEVLEALKVLTASTDKRLTSIEEALTSAAVELVSPEASEESAVEVIDNTAVILEATEALAASTLDATGRLRVLELHKATGKGLPELIAAEESYIKTLSVAVAEDEGVEESADRVTTPEAIRTPSAWKVNK